MRIGTLALAAILSFLIISIADAKERSPSPMLAFVRPDHGVPVTSVTVGEGRTVLDELSVDDRNRLLQDGLVLSSQGGSDGMNVGYVIVNMPREEVWRTVNQPAEWYKFLPGVEKAKRVRNAANNKVVWYQLRVSFVTLEFQAEHKYWPEVSRMAWGLDPGYDNSLRRQDGYYNIYALDEKTTLIEYGTRIETNPLVPSFVQEYLVKSALPDALAGMKKFMDSGGTYRKE